MDALDDFAQEAADKARKAQTNGTGNHRAHYGVGVLAILAGATAAGLGFGDADPLLTGVGGTAATVLAGVQTLFQFEPKAQYHYAKVADYNAVRRTCVRLTSRTVPPTQDELQQIEDHLNAIEARSFQRVGVPTGPGAA